MNKLINIHFNPFSSYILSQFKGKAKSYPRLAKRAACNS